MPSPVAPAHDPSKLFHYLVPHRVLICKSCTYAIQPSAISRHLKELHHIYRSDRQKLMQYIQTLDLADPSLVVLPEPQDAPIPFLTTESGLACNQDDCHHLCVSLKRMKSHWAMMHKGLVPDSASWRPVNLQTFFRGNQLRYFVVCKKPPAYDAPQVQELKSFEKQTSCQPSTLDSPYVNWNWIEGGAALLRNFKNSTYLSLGDTQYGREMWRDTIPDLAHKHAFLMHGILAISALHLAALNPEEKQQYQYIAACHQSKALPEFRATVETPNVENCNALVAFQRLLVLHCFASESHDEDLFIVRGEDFPEWLHIFRTSCSVLHTFKDFITFEPLGNIITGMVEWLPGEKVEELPKYAEHSQRLFQLMRIHLDEHQRYHTNHASGEYCDSPFPAATLELVRAFHKAHLAMSRSEYTIWTGVFIWPAQVSDDFLDLLRHRNPAALILLAHYCILLKPLESEWYMKGFSKRLLSRILRQLDPGWRHWIQWPLEEIGCLEAS